MTFNEFFKRCEFNFWEGYYDDLPYITVFFKGPLCEYEHSQTIHKKLYFENRKTAKELTARSLYQELVAVGEINDFRRIS